MDISPFVPKIILMYLRTNLHQSNIIYMRERVYTVNIRIEKIERNGV